MQYIVTAHRFIKQMYKVAAKTSAAVLTAVAHEKYLDSLREF
ncbi:hypothetical protein [Pyrobaculum islandicum]|nr:hypothetical protein [Pyrobaculum islandicum]